MDDVKREAVQNVLDRVSSYQDGAQEGMVEQQLREGLSEVGVELSDAEVNSLVEAVEKHEGAVRADQVLG